jgi:hypothetical protein
MTTRVVPPFLTDDGEDSALWCFFYTNTAPPTPMR